jgi:ABC-type phosphate/phosphonate transport system substrate-binding protein
MSKASQGFIACGMYAFTDAQQSAWRQLFARLAELAAPGAGGVRLSFLHDPQLLLQPDLWFGHTCGYPLMTRLQQHVSPFCVPLFDVAGTDGPLYCSRIIAAADSAIESIVDGRGCVAAMNNPDSNSGMNVLRHAVAEVHKGGDFFARVKTTGGHLHSLQAVAEGAADIAAIDCVSYRLIEDWRPELCERVRIIADSVKTCGLPLVMSHATLADTDTGRLTAMLNEALAGCASEVTDTLHLTGFAEVTLDDYRGILELEEYAVERGYPRLS